MNNKKIRIGCQAMIAFCALIMFINAAATGTVSVLPHTLCCGVVIAESVLIVLEEMNS